MLFKLASYELRSAVDVGMQVRVDEAAGEGLPRRSARRFASRLYVLVLVSGAVLVWRASLQWHPRSSSLGLFFVSSVLAAMDVQRAALRAVRRLLRRAAVMDFGQHLNDWTVMVTMADLALVDHSRCVEACRRGDAGSGHSHRDARCPTNCSKWIPRRVWGLASMRAFAYWSLMRRSSISSFRR